MSQYLRSYNELKADEEISKMRPVRGMHFGRPRTKNNRKSTNGRRIQIIQLRDGGTKQIIHKN